MKLTPLIHSGEVGHHFAPYLSVRKDWSVEVVTHTINAYSHAWAKPDFDMAGLNALEPARFASVYYLLHYLKDHEIIFG